MTAGRHRLHRFFAGALGLASTMLAGAGALSPVEAAPYEIEQVLYSFCAQNGCPDGSAPAGPLVTDGSGNLYGTTSSGGTGFGDYGTVFELTPGVGGWTEKVIYNFCSIGACVDGAFPVSGLTMDAAGNLYGAAAGGTGNGGIVFELTPNQAHTAWTETVLYNFCSQSGCADGKYPNGGLILGQDGSLYGTTQEGGTGYGGDYGTAYRLTPNQAHTAWTEAVLYNFCSQSSQSYLCTDGGSPLDGLTADAAGNLYGTTDTGGTTQSGSYPGGTVFELVPNQQKTAWTHTVLYNFCTLASCLDGQSPQSGLIIDSGGRLYGTTYAGGSASSGTVFAVKPNQGSATEMVLYSFCSQANCNDGISPSGRVAMDSVGNLYGATGRGGSGSGGVAYELIPNQMRTSWRETVLYAFCSQSNCIDGSTAQGGLLLDKTGSLYGITNSGGAHGDGAAFAVRPGVVLVHPPVSDMTVAAPATSALSR
ncbi:MAG: hypothetical protein JO267_00285 [Alphaproteobacteria bacterium]|nr:hypothetical protein [Alphaproteobacteria bacterium]